MDQKLIKQMEQALCQIYNICGKTKRCNGCPALGEDGVCRQFESAPFSWKIDFEPRSRWSTGKTWKEYFWEEQEKKEIA